MKRADCRVVWNEYWKPLLDLNTKSVSRCMLAERMRDGSDETGDAEHREFMRHKLECP